MMELPYHFPLFHGKVQMLAQNDKCVKKLRISRKELSTDSFRTFCKVLQQNKYLEELWVDGGFLELDLAFALASAIEENKVLKVLRLRCISFGGSTATKAILDVVAASTTLQELYLEGNELNANDGPQLGILARRNKSLRVLHIENNPIRDKGVAALAVGLQSNTTLTELSLHNVGLSYAVGYELTDLMVNTTKLRLLHIIDNPNIPPQALCKFFKQLERNDSLAFFVMKGNPIDAKAAQSIADVMTRNRALKRMVLWGNGIDDASASVIANGIRQNETITEVRLQMNRIGDKGTVALANALVMHKSMKIVDLMLNPVNEVGGKALAKALYQNKMVECINLHGTGVQNMDEIEGLIRLNRAGRRLFSAPDVSSALWSHAIARVRSQPDLVFLLLQENPSIIPRPLQGIVQISSGALR
jgi:Ran GTPase-activating protein (RanGAP) involved in mRNA processing and transport